VVPFENKHYFYVVLMKGPLVSLLAHNQFQTGKKNCGLIAPLTPSTAVNEEELKELEVRKKLIVVADRNQYPNEFSIKRYLRAFKSGYSQNHQM
jgi:hypothetical protein